jgi:serine phosphatase RsbU (regulator of sigma subunit)
MHLPLPARVLSKLIQVIGHVSSNKEDIFRLAAGQVLDLFDVDACFFGVPEKEGMRVAGARATDPEMETWLTGRRFNIPCAAYQDGMMICVNNAREDETCEDGLLRGWAGSHLCLPLTVRGERMGSMTVAARNSHVFTNEEIDLYLAVAALVAIAVQNANMYSTSERQAHELRDSVRAKTRSISAVSRISEKINAANSRKEVQDAVAEEIGSVTACSAVTLAIPENQDLTITVMRGKPQGISNGDRIALRDTVMPSMIGTGKARVHTGKPNAETACLVGADARSFAIAPLMAGSRFIGSLNLARTTGPAFKHSDLPNLTQVAGQIVAALTRIDTFERERDAAAELKTLYAASSALTSTVRLRDTLRIICGQLALATHSSACLLFELDGQTSRLVASHGNTIERVHTSLCVALPSDMLENLHEAVIYNEQEWSGPAGGWLNALASHLGEHIILAPVMEREQPIAIAIVARHRTPYGSADLRISSAIAGQAATAIQASQVYEHERSIAEAFQRNLLPPPDYKRSGLCIASRYQAALEEAEVGGDFYDIIELDNHLVGIAVGDISGKGLNAATQAASVKYMLDAYALQDPSPAATLGRLNYASCQSLGESFATLFYGLVDLEKRTLTYANAGHELPVMISGGIPRESLEVTGPALALCPDAVYSNLTVDLGDDDLVLCYTDGITEARSGGGLWGYEGLIEALQRCPSPEPRTVVDHVYECALEYSRGRLADDVILLAIRQG